MRVKFQMQQSNISYYPLGNNNYTFFICLNEKIVEETSQYEEGTAVSTLYEYDFNEFNESEAFLKNSDILSNPEKYIEYIPKVNKTIEERVNEVETTQDEIVLLMADIIGGNV